MYWIQCPIFATVVKLAPIPTSYAFEKGKQLFPNVVPSIYPSPRTLSKETQFLPNYLPILQKNHVS